MWAGEDANQLFFLYGLISCLLFITRRIKGICGLTQEIIIGLVANLESREQRRVEYEDRGLPPEHPRASGSDDVEGIIGLMHEMLGDIFDMKQLIDAQRKIFNEFTKRIDPDLKFFYWSGTGTQISNCPPMELAKRD